MKYKIFFAFITCITTSPFLNAMEDHQTLLTKAIYSTNITSIKKCLASGAKACEEININGNAIFPILFAAKLTFPRLVETLINAGASANTKDAKGKTPLHYASSTRLFFHLINDDHLKTIRILIEAKAIVDEVDQKGETPLMKTLNCNPCLERTKALLNAGASTLLRRFKDQKSALDLAMGLHAQSKRMLDEVPLSQLFYHSILKKLNSLDQIITLLSERQKMEIMPHLNGARQIEGNRKGHYRNKPRNVNRLKDETKK